ncbi:F-box-like domain-containing protein [Candidatus Protochlamydia phocaeensis]|uniref:F-box-like domain-containing protein n=1 Tax=Candidatus Protochlamydia phocaeensis TaxID=1414722 RepID=UPI0008380C42|nr:F-box protein [Candidatus Protochlamydia phocaeensis]
MFNSIGKFIIDLRSQYFQQREVRKEVKADFVKVFPKEMTQEIFSYLNADELARCQRVNREWKVKASDEALWNALPPKIAFGKKQWAKYFGDVGIEPPFPKDIHKILKSPCPFWPGKKVEETHMLVLIPETINGKPLNLKTWGELVKAPKQGHATQYKYIWDAIINEHGNQGATKSHWVLMTKDVIEGSRNKTYTDQQALIAEFAKKTEINYEVPNVLDATIGIFMHYIRFGEHLFKADDLWTYTRCQEKAQDWQIVVGGFSLAGLYVRSLSIDFYSIGVAALRKFF